MNSEVVKEIRELEARATKGTWEARSVKGMLCLHANQEGHLVQIYLAPHDPSLLPITHDRQKADAHFIAVIRNSIIPILSALDAAEVENKELRAILDEKVEAEIKAKEKERLCSDCQYEAEVTNKMPCIGCFETENKSTWTLKIPIGIVIGHLRPKP